MSEVIRVRLSAIYRAAKSKHVDFLMNAFDDDVEYLTYAPSKIFPYLGHRRGKASVAESFRLVFDNFELLTLEPISMLAEEDKAAVLLFVRVYHRPTMRTIQTMIAHFLRFKETRIVEVRQFMDAIDAIEQLMGQELNIKLPLLVE